MGLLDQVLGQVLGNLGGTTTSGGPSQQAGGGQFGNVGGQLGGLLKGQGGPIALAILALLASKHLSTGAGGYGSTLHDMLAGQGRGAGGQEPDVSQPQASTGGFMNEIGGMLGGGGGSSGTSSVGSGGLGSSLGGALSGGALAGGLGELLKHFQQNGGGDLVGSWIGSGPNHLVDPGTLEQHLGSDTVDDLSRQTGMDRGDLLSQLSQALPQVVDKLTPQGRLPTEDEGSRWV